MLLFLTNYTKESNYLYAIPLKEFYTDRIKIGTKSSLSRYCIPYTKGAHLFCCAPLESQFLRLAVAVKTKILMIAYKHAAIMTVNGSPMTPTISANPMDNFIKHRELSLPDVPVNMTLLDERPSGKVCVSYQKQTVVDAIDEIMATAQRIPNLDIAKGKLTTLSGVHENGRSELLIGYNLTCQLVTLHDGMAYNSTEIVWNAEPKDVVYMSPYVLAFTADTVEIRMASNGSLIQTIAVPDLHLLSKKGDLYFTSSSNMIQSNMAKTPTPTRPSPVVPAKFPKNIDKKDFSSSTRLNEVSGLTYIYRITMQKMTGRSRSESMSSFTSAQRSGSEEQLLTNRASVSEIISEGDSLDDVHPILEDDERPIMMTDFGSESPPDTGLRSEEDSSDKRSLNSKNLPVFNEVSFSNGMNQTDCAMPRRRVRAVSGRSWNNCIPEYSPFPSSNSHTKIHSPQSSNGSSSGVADTASLLSSDSRLGQPPVIDLICASPDSGVVHDDFHPLSSTSHGHSVASSSHDHSPPPHKTVQSHSILVDENQNTCTSNHSTAPSVTNVLDSMDTQLHFTS